MFSVPRNCIASSIFLSVKKLCKPFNQGKSNALFCFLSESNLRKRDVGWENFQSMTCK